MVGGKKRGDGEEEDDRETKKNREDNREEERQRLKEERYMRMCQIGIRMAPRLFPSALQELQSE